MYLYNNAISKLDSHYYLRTCITKCILCIYSICKNNQQNNMNECVAQLKAIMCQ